MFNLNLKHTFNKSPINTIVLMVVLMAFVQSCVNSPGGKKASLKSASTNTGSTPTKLPDFKSGNNYIQNGSSIFTSSVNLDVSFSDTIQLRGKDVDTYIRSNGTQNVMCLTARFTSPAVNKIILLAAIPRSVNNFNTQTLEYYYNISPSDSQSNQSFCQKTGITNQLFSLYPTLTLKYKLDELCPGGVCSASFFSSQGLELYSPGGIALTQIPTRQLLFYVANNPVSSDPTATTCTESSQCRSLGFDCCSLGQCVSDLSLKPGVDTSSTDYQQALQDILNNPSNIYQYPNYYFLCSIPVNQPTDPSTPADPINEANTRLKDLTNLYNCTTKIEGEYGVCTKTYTNASVGTFYEAGKDDRNFAGTFTHRDIGADTLVSIEEITYGEVVLFNYAQKTDAQLIPNVYEDANVRIEGIHNDDVATATRIQVKTNPPSAVSKDLVIKYKIDASCSLVNSSLAKCEKHYVQGKANSGDTPESNRRGRVTDHFPESNSFKLPYYASTNKAVTVEVDGITQRQDLDWQLNVSAPSSVEFLPTNTLRVFKDQKVKITFFVDLNVNKVMDSKLEALTKIKNICTCSGLNCSLSPVRNSTNQIVDYACIYPDPIPTEPPLNQKVYLSSKTVPVRYFDENGVSQSVVNSSTTKQEGREFKYRKDNLLNPNNMPDITLTNDTSDTYVGFNEIYGTLSYSTNSARGAREVNVKKGRTYDIYVDRGTFSNCIQCGNDYYSQLNKLFPLAEFGGGITPNRSATNRSLANSTRSDDLAFGRACLVPATMIPWTHGTESDGQTQRLNRMRAQHALFANGYQTDWYGFDYGSVIGSFDGVRWFSIGTNRRIKADTNKLFIAVNGIFGDLTLESTYEVSINDSSLNPEGTSMVTSDFDSDGAQCQRYHQCSTDNDCATTLGWEYACAAVNDTTTSWPKFDDNAKEIPEAMREDNRLTSILGLSSVGKRCVYRGRGALCSQNYASSAININSTFNQSTNQTLHGCSANNYCQPISSGGTANPKFNNRIVRYGKVRPDTTYDSFGKGARVPGRPYSYQGEEVIRTETLKNLNSNKALAMCLPGRSPEAVSFLAQHQTTPGPDYLGDKTLGIGMTYRKNTVSPTDDYLAACSILDSTNNFYHNTAATPSATNATNQSLINDSGTQAISTNALSVFKTIFDSKSINFDIYRNPSSILNSISFQENRCLRAPGASCHTDLDCAPSKTIADKIKSLNPDDTAVSSRLNKYEVKFWQEELVCSQATEKTSSTYDPKNNRCCREVGKIISIASGDNANGFDMDAVPGIDYNMASSLRYSRVATVYKDVQSVVNGGLGLPALNVAVKDQCATPAGCALTTNLSNQFRTFSSMAERTSCSGDWVRNFTNGTHRFESTKFQTFNSQAFRCMNWLPGKFGWTCAGLEQDDPNCYLTQTSPFSPKAKGILDYLGRMELMGIPQIAMESESFFNSAVTSGVLSCVSHPDSQSLQYPNHPTNPGGTYLPPNNFFTAAATSEYEDVGGNEYLSAVDNTNFIGMKQIFKADEVVSCMPAGTTMPVGSDPARCCTGTINPENNKCQLPDYVDLSVYTNRYVSSEGKKLNISLFDQNGYIKDPSYVAQLACEKQMCQSGSIIYGLLISRLPIPGQEDNDDNKVFRFLEGNATSDNINGLLDLYNKGLKLNNHAYCAPRGLNTQNSEDFTLISCGTTSN